MSKDLPDLPADRSALREDSERSKVVSVFLSMPLDREYSYSCAAELPVKRGSVVEVPVRGRKVLGVVHQLEPEKTPLAQGLQKLTHLFSCNPFPEDFLQFLAFMAQYTLTPIGTLIRMALRVPTALEKPKPPTAFQCVAPGALRLTEARKKVLACFAQKPLWSKAELLQRAQVSAAVFETLRRHAVLQEVPLEEIKAPAFCEESFALIPLESEQKRAADLLLQKVAQKHFSVSLLDGVTGSGKTEVYFAAVASALKAQQQILILLPEIALTQQFLGRFRQRFGIDPLLWHSDLAPGLRTKTWRRVNAGEPLVVIGARSALFLPFQNLKLIIVDEEHDSAYKQEEGIFYHARDMAVARAKFGNFPVILSSATPSIESYVNACRGKYEKITLKARFAAAALPELEVVDLRKTPPPPGRFLAPPLEEALTETLEKKEQALLFLNRRGYAPLTLCQACGYRFSCPHCSSWLVEHRFRKCLMCHHCGYRVGLPARCPSCNAQDSLRACGPGVERIGEEIEKLFPQARILILSTDLLGSVTKIRAELESIAQGAVDIIIGTQLISKGHNFPAISLVGVIDGDLGLANADPRAAERTFQLLFQVTGRAGRDGRKSRGLIQTYHPQNPILRALLSGSKEMFYKIEVAERKNAALPPFGRLASLIISGRHAGQTLAYARKIRQAFPTHPSFTVLGPAEAPLSLIRDYYRFRILVQSAKGVPLQEIIQKTLESSPSLPKNMRLHIDIDPQSFL